MRNRQIPIEPLMPSELAGLLRDTLRLAARAGLTAQGGSRHALLFLDLEIKLLELARDLALAAEEVR